MVRREEAETQPEATCLTTTTHSKCLTGVLTPEVEISWNQTWKSHEPEPRRRLTATIIPHYCQCPTIRYTSIHLSVSARIAGGCII